MRISPKKYLTVVVIPSDSSRIHRYVVSFFAIVGAVFFFVLVATFLGHSLWNSYRVHELIALNKKLQGENYKLQLEVEQAKGKAEKMDWQMDKIQNYVRKLQALMQDEEPLYDRQIKKESSLFEKTERKPSSLEGNYKKQSRDWLNQFEKIERDGFLLQAKLADLQFEIREKSALLDSTPSLLPVEGWLSSGFGVRRHPIHGELRLHKGVDLVAEVGSSVRAPANGRVVFSGNKPGFGKVIVLDHGYGLRTLYAHNQKLLVHLGDKVKRGEQISEVGSTGRSTGPHLHYEVRKNGLSVNPMKYIPRLED